MTIQCIRTLPNGTVRRAVSLRQLSLYDIYVGSGASSYLDDSCDRYARNMTSFGFHDVTVTNNVSRCDVPDDEVLAGQYRCSPATIQVAPIYR